jgi:hypothetical protein
MISLSLSSFGSTICPRSSTLINDSTRQQLAGLSAVSQQDVFVLAMMIYCLPTGILITMHIQIYQLMLIIISRKEVVKGRDLMEGEKKFA